MLIIPSRLTKNGHIRSPWVVGYCILGFLIFKDWWVDLHLGDLFLHAMICSYCWMLSSLSSAENFDCLLNQNSHPQKSWASREASRNPWCSLSPMSSTTSTNMPNLRATLLIIISINFTSSNHLPIRHSLIQYSYPIINITGSSWGPGSSLWPSGASRHPSFHFPFYDGTSNSSLTFLHSVYYCFYLAVLLAQLTGPLKPRSTSFAFL